MQFHIKRVVNFELSDYKIVSHICINNVRSVRKKVVHRYIKNRAEKESKKK